MRAIVIGSIILDERFAVFALPRPGESLLATGGSGDLGGKGANQAVLLGRAGLATRLVACIGNDDAAERLRAALAAEPVENGLIATALPSDRSIILVDPSGEHCMISTTECALAMSVTSATDALACACACDLLVMQGNVQYAVTRAALTAARRAGLRTVLNPAPVDGGTAALLPLLDLVVVNQFEAKELTGTADPHDALACMHAGGSARSVVTLGDQGAVMEANKTVLHVPAATTRVCDTVGAGDTFTSVLAAALFERRLGDQEALIAASRAAAITVSRPGTLAAFPSAAELRGILGQPCET